MIIVETQTPSDLDKRLQTYLEQKKYYEELIISDPKANKPRKDAILQLPHYVSRNTYPRMDLSELPTLYKSDRYFTFRGEENEFTVDIDSEEISNTLLPILRERFDTFIIESSKGRYHLHYKIPVNFKGIKHVSFKDSPKKIDLLGSGHLRYGNGVLGRMSNGEIYSIYSDIPVRTLSMEEFQDLVFLFDENILDEVNQEKLTSKRRPYIRNKDRELTETIQRILSEAPDDATALLFLQKLTLKVSNVAMGDIAYVHSKCKTPVADYIFERGESEFNSNGIEFAVAAYLMMYTKLSAEEVYSFMLSYYDSMAFSKSLKSDGKFTLSVNHLKKYACDGCYTDEADRFIDESENFAMGKAVDTEGRKVAIVCIENNPDDFSRKSKVYSIIWHSEDCKRVISRETFADKTTLRHFVANDSKLKPHFCIPLKEGELWDIDLNSITPLRIKTQVHNNFDAQELTFDDDGKAVCDMGLLKYSERVKNYRTTLFNTSYMTKEKWENLRITQLYRQILPNGKVFWAKMYCYRECILRRKPLPFGFYIVGEHMLGKSIFSSVQRYLLTNPNSSLPFVTSSPTIEDFTKSTSRWLGEFIQNIGIFCDELGFNDSTEYTKDRAMETTSLLNENAKKFIRATAEVSGDVKYSAMKRCVPIPLYVDFATNSMCLSFEGLSNSRLVASLAIRKLGREFFDSFDSSAEKLVAEEGDEFLGWILSDDASFIDEIGLELMSTPIEEWDDYRILTDTGDDDGEDDVNSTNADIKSDLETFVSLLKRGDFGYLSKGNYRSDEFKRAVFVEKDGISHLVQRALYDRKSTNDRQCLKYNKFVKTLKPLIETVFKGRKLDIDNFKNRGLKTAIMSMYTLNKSPGMIDKHTYINGYRSPPESQGFIWDPLAKEYVKEK